MNVKCKVCDRGEMVRRKRYRMSGIVVFIGYVLLVPSVFGCLIGALALFGTCAAVDETFRRSDYQVRMALEDAGIPTPLIVSILDHEELTLDEVSVLDDEQRSAVRTAEARQ